MEIDWHKVAVSLNRAASKDLDIALNASDGDPEKAKEFRIRGSILMSPTRCSMDCCKNPSAFCNCVAFPYLRLRTQSDALSKLQGKVLDLKVRAGNGTEAKSTEELEHRCVFREDLRD